jgi:hypothetical protein
LLSDLLIVRCLPFYSEINIFLLFTVTVYCLLTLSMGLTVVQLELPLMSMMTVNPISRTSSLKQKKPKF